jgi:DNA polymerase I-like protein with 3'-5' exonuclease and polymerase domains
MSYVLYCGKFDMNIESLIKEILKIENIEELLIDDKKIFGIGKKKLKIFDIDLDNELTKEYLCQYSLYIFMLYKKLKTNIDLENKLLNFYNTIELPLIKTLAEIEINGFSVNFKINLLTFILLLLK